ncbi:MAG: hypothetical protein ACRCY4_06385 [Brevinema sp.]
MNFFIFSIFMLMGISTQAQSFVDNTNSEGLSSMQRAINTEDIKRMEGLIENGAGYYYMYGKARSPLINHAISNNKPKAIEFLLSKQTVVDASTVLLAMSKTNYTLVKRLLDENHLRDFRDIDLIKETNESTGRFSNIVEIEPHDTYTTNWQLSYVLTNRRGVSQLYTSEITNYQDNPESYILEEIKKQKQQDGLKSFSQDISLIKTNTLNKTNMRKEEIFRNRSITNSTNSLVPIELDGTNYSGELSNNLLKIAIMAIKQENLPMLSYFIDKGISLKEYGNLLLNHAAMIAHKEMVIYLLNKGADPLDSHYYDPLLLDNDLIQRCGIDIYVKESTPFTVVSWILNKLSSDYFTYEENRLQSYKKYHNSSNQNDIATLALQEKKLANTKKNLPKWKEIQALLKKYEE